MFSVWPAALLAITYAAVGWLGLMLAIPPGHVTAVWPPSGIALGALLVWGAALWPGIWVGALVVDAPVLFDPARGASPLVALAVGAAIATGATVQALIACRLIAHLTGGRGILEWPGGVFRLAAAAAATCLIGAVIGSGSLWLGGYIPRSALATTGWTWWLGNVVGMIVVAPLLLAWFNRPALAAGGGSRVEALALLATLLTVGLLVFGDGLPSWRPGASTSYLVFPPLLWAALRFGPRGAAAGVALMTVMAVISTAHGRGPFLDANLQQNLWMVQGFGAAMALSKLSLAALVVQHATVERGLQQLNATLEHQVAERTAEAELRAHDLTRAEQESRDRAKTLRSILDTILEGVIVADPDGRLVLWNPAVRRLVGANLIELHPKDWPAPYGCFLPNGTTPFPTDRLPLLRALSGEVVVDEELLLRSPARPEGVWLSLSAVPLRNEAGAVAGAVAVFRDVTDSTHAEHRLRSVVEWMMAGIIMLDGAGTITMVNRQTETILGFPRDELVGRPVDILRAATSQRDDAQSLMDLLRTLDRGETATSGSVAVRRKDDQDVMLQVTLNSILIDGRPFVLASFLDVTEQKRAADLIESVVEFSPDGTVMVNQEGRIVLINRESERMFGYTRAELIGQPVEILVPERDRRLHAALVQRFLTERRHRAMNHGRTFYACRKDGSEFPADIALHSYERHGEPFAIASIRDMTERHNLLEAVETNLLIQDAIARVLRASLETISVDEHLERALDLILSVPWFAGRARGGIFLVEGDPRALVLKARRSLPTEALEDRAAAPDGFCLCGHPAEHREVVFAAIDDRDGAPEMARSTLGRYCVPILGEDRLYGVINIFLDEPHRTQRPEEAAFLASVAGVLAGTIERKRAEEALRASEERFDLAVRGTDAGIWDWDLRTGRVYYSPRWKSILGYADDELGNDFAEWDSRLHPDDRERAHATVAAYLEGHTADFELEHRLRHKDGSYRWILARGVAVRDAAGRPYRIVGSHIDITAFKQTLGLLNENLVQLRAAQKIQQALLPARPPKISGYDIAGMSHPAAFAGGDLYDYVAMPDGGLGVLVGDVSGHGLAAALQMASTHAFLRSLSQTCSTINEIMTRLNQFVYDESNPESFVTMELVRINPRRRTLTYANAGHPPAYLLNGSGDLKAMLNEGTEPLGIEPHLDFPLPEPIALAPGDLILLLTDGILDAESPTGECFGGARVLAVLRAERARPGAEILEALRRAVLEHRGGQAPTDDLTAVIVRVMP